MCLARGGFLTVLTDFASHKAFMQLLQQSCWFAVSWSRLLAVECARGSGHAEQMMMICCEIPANFVKRSPYTSVQTYYMRWLQTLLDGRKSLFRSPGEFMTEKKQMPIPRRANALR